MLWGKAVSFWDLWGLRLMFVGAALGGVALVASLASSFILYKVADRIQSGSDQRIAEANAQAEEAKARALEAQLALEKLKEPRTLSSEQQSEIASALRQFAGQQYEGQIGSGIPDAFSLWASIDKALSTAGWARVVPNGEMVGNPPASLARYVSVGVAIGITNASRGTLIPVCVKLVTALGKAGIRAGVAYDEKGDIPPNVIVIQIGAKTM